MNRDEAVKKIAKAGGLSLFYAEDLYDSIIPKPTVPQFIAEWIEDHKEDYAKWDEEARADFVFRAINDLFRFGDGLNTWDFTIDEKFSEWTTENAYEFITAILFGYTVKKEKLYTVEIPNPNLDAHTILQKTKKGIILAAVGNARWKGWKSSKLTEAEIKQDFDWLWQFAKEVKE